MKQIGLVIIILSIKTLFAANGLKGIILDKKTQIPLAGVNILVDGSPRGAASDQNGHFLIEALPPGSYNVKFMFIGYLTALKSNVIIAPQRMTEMVVEMEEDILESDVIEATASYFDKPKEAVVSTRSMDFEEIRRSPGALVDIQRVVQVLPAVVSGTDQNNEIIIRGGIPGENLFLMDNIEIPNPNHFGEQGTGGGPINMLNTYMVRKVDFYAGAFAAKYGDKASSVMDIILRDGTNVKFRGEGYIGMAGAGLLLEGPITEFNGTYAISARKSFLDLIISSIGLSAVPKYYNLQGKMTLDINPKNRIYINTIYGNDQITIENEGTGGYSRGAENVNYTGDQYAIGATLRTFWSNNMYSNTTVSDVHNNWDIDVYRTETQKTYLWNKSKESETTLKTDFVFQLDKQVELNWGGSYKFINFNHDIWAEADTIFWFSGPEDVQPDSIFRVYPPFANKNNIHSYKTALYAQISYDLLKKFRLTAGLRYDYFKYNNFNSLSPRLGFTYMVSPKTNINVAYGIHNQAPAYVQLTANQKNTTLASKYTDQIVIGIEKLFREDIKVSLEAYYKKYHKVPVTRSSTTPNPLDNYEGEMLNLGSGFARGIEFFFQKKLIKNFSAIVSYAYSVSKAKDLRYNVDYNWDYDFRNVFTFIGGYKFELRNTLWYPKIKTKWWYYATLWLPFMPSDEVEVSTKFRYLGGRPYTSPTYYPQYQRWFVEEQQQINPVRYPAYHRLDLRIDRRIHMESLNMVFYLDFMNIYNRHNIWEYQHNDDGTTEDILQFEVFPVYGFSIEF